MSTLHFLRHRDPTALQRRLTRLKILCTSQPSLEALQFLMRISPEKDDLSSRVERRFMVESYKKGFKGRIHQSVKKRIALQRVRQSENPTAQCTSLHIPPKGSKQPLG
jgi:hypothetical protein